VSKCQTGRQIERKDNRERDSGNPELMGQKELGSLMPIFDSQEAFSKKPQTACQDQAKHEIS